MKFCKVFHSADDTNQWTNLVKILIWIWKKAHCFVKLLQNLAKCGKSCWFFNTKENNETAELRDNLPDEFG